MEIKAWGGQWGWREPAQGASPGLGQGWHSRLPGAVCKGIEAEIPPVVRWGQPSWGQQGCNPGLSSQGSAQTENFCFVQALSCTWSAARPEHLRQQMGSSVPAVPGSLAGTGGRGLLRPGFCGRRAAGMCAWGVSYFALYEGPQHSPRVLLSDKVNRIKKMLPNAL